MTLALLGIGLLAYTAAIVACCNIERDYKWRRWMEESRPRFGPDGRDAFGKHRWKLARNKCRSNGEGL